MDVWIVCLVVACLFGIGELHSNGFFLAPFALGAFLAAMVSLAGAGALLAAGAGIVASLFVLATLTPARRHRRLPPLLRTGAQALIGEGAVVTKEINPQKEGAVRIGGEVWTARSHENETLVVGEHVFVSEIKGATAFVLR